MRPIRGEGVALGRSVLVAEDLAAGRLVSLFPKAKLEVRMGLRPRLPHRQLGSSQGTGISKLDGRRGAGVSDLQHFTLNGVFVAEPSVPGCREADT
jgi:hypothetical protein